MKKNEPVCVTCNQAFAMTNWLTKLIQKEHTELWWNFCAKIFRNRNEVGNLIYEACESTCHECSAKDEVENGKEDSFVQKAYIIIKKDMGSKEIMRNKENM